MLHSPSPQPHVRRLAWVLTGEWIQVWFGNNCTKPMERAMALHSSTLSWRIPWMEEPGGLQSMGSLGVGHDWVTSLSLFTFMHWRRKWQSTPVFLPGESQGRGSLVGFRLWGHTDQTRLNRLSSSSAKSILLETPDYGGKRQQVKQITSLSVVWKYEKCPLKHLCN